MSVTAEPSKLTVIKEMSACELIFSLVPTSCSSILGRGVLCAVDALLLPPSHQSLRSPSSGLDKASVIIIN